MLWLCRLYHGKDGDNVANGCSADETSEGASDKYEFSTTPYKLVVVRNGKISTIKTSLNDVTYLLTCLTWRSDRTVHVDKIKCIKNFSQ